MAIATINPATGQTVKTFSGADRRRGRPDPGPAAATFRTYR